MHMNYNSHLKDEVRRFYTEVLGFTEHRDEPGGEYLYVRTGSSSSLGFTPPQEGPPEEWRPPREPALYLIVTDVDAAHRAARERGASFDQEPRDMPWGHRVATLRDPEGRLIHLAQRLRSGHPETDHAD
jgi:predicted enzyme related to lactoylglutathione lyase